MTRGQSTNFLRGFFAIALAAIVFRIDNFPLTWVPMYAEYEPVQDVSLRVWDKAEIARGFQAVRRDGRVEWVNHQRLNIPRTKFIRLYYERAFGLGPPKDYQSHLALSETNRALRELFDPDPKTSVFWDWRLLYAVNRSLGRQPANPDFVIALRAPALQRVFRLDDLGDGGGVTPQDQRVTATAVWQPSWLDRWLHRDI